MHRKSWLLAVAASMLLASCGNSKKEPTGQVAARVGKDEITVQEVQAELGNFRAPNPQILKRAQQQAVQNIVNRKLLAEAAKDAGLAKTPEFAMQKEKVNEALLVQAWQTKLAAAVPQPSRDEALKFINDHPAMYANHARYAVDQIRMPRVADASLVKELEPLNTLEEVEGVLRSRNITFNRGMVQVDALQFPPQLLDQIVKLPPGEIFVIPSQDVLLINRITGVTPIPFTGENAVKHATQFMKLQRTQESVQRQFSAVVQKGQAEVKYNKAFAPPAPPAKGAAPAAPAKK